MALPTVKSSTKISKIGDRKIKIRAYSGKEEKALLMAKLQKDPKALVQTCIDVLSSCAEFDASTLSTGEFEKLFLDIRCISVSDVLEPNLVCTACQQATPAKIPVAQLKEPEKYVEEKDFEVGEDASGNKIFVRLRTPSIGDITRLGSEDESDMKIIHASVKSIYTSGGEVFEDFEYEEFRDWFEKLTGVYLQAVLFAREAPTITYTKKFKCVHCKADNEYELKGLESFLL
ncbi:baseplate hub [Sinorhizobium phage phiM9]|uniref:Putative baseplate hub subunit n=1 Tax=Sinorhizobium phage phiM9 TaxID=1636182 RepID=A0A0F6THG2_9CAUD|nr:baseplate hub [Sinorhizobium phage phiM9]AKE44681.1 putative baseplate hub subunit [Sinorhizobium phage phiM9]